MTRLRSIIFFASIFLIGGTSPLLAAAVSGPAAVGLTYDFTSRIVTTDQAGIERDQVVLKGSAAILGDKVRIDIHDAGSGSVMNGAYMLAFDGGRRLIWVNSDRKQYFEVESLNMMGKMNDLVNGSNGLIKAEASNVQIDVKKVGVGPVIEGQETVHYRMTQKMDMKTRVLHKSTSSNEESTIDYYYAPNLQHFVNPFLSSSQDLGGAMTFLGQEYMRQVQAAYSQLYQGGAPLKTVMTSRSIDEFGNVRTSTATTEVSNLKTGPLSDDRFDIPAGFSKAESVEAMNGKEKEPASAPSSGASAKQKPQSR